MRGALGVALLGRYARTASAGAWSAAAPYAAGQRVVYAGRIWIATAAVPAGVAPQGTTADRDLLLAQIDGFAGGAGILGGYNGPTYVVTRTDDPNPTGSATPGTLRYALTYPGPLWITFAADGVYTYYPRIRYLGNKTIDCRGRNVELRAVAPSTSCSVIDGVADVLIAWARMSTYSYGTNDDVLTVQRGSGSGPTPAGTGWDKLGLWHNTFYGGGDGVTDITSAVSTPSRATVAWNRYGPHPTAEALAWAISKGTLGNNNSADNGKERLVGAANGIGDSADFPDNVRVTFHHNYSLGSVQRHPEVRRGRVHIYNDAIAKWGYPPGVNAGNSSYGPAGLQANTDGEVLSENNIFDAYAVNEGHVLDGSPVTSPATNAIAITTPTVKLPSNSNPSDYNGPAPQAYVRDTGSLYLNGATGGQQDPTKVFRGYSQSDTAYPWGVVAEHQDPSTDWGGVPPYSYSLETADATLYAKLKAAAGNTPLWVALS